MWGKTSVASWATPGHRALAAEIGVAVNAQAAIRAWLVAAVVQVKVADIAAPHCVALARVTAGRVGARAVHARTQRCALVNVLLAVPPVKPFLKEI